ncbi:hypothetical protein V5799_022709 [Amblyomma americanum]|uniref:Uncharacterized protein n=1 Tax=Amblyomma americanum TaxID=6943 RepID=A0AAQ4FJU2_AMBAM
MALEAVVSGAIALWPEVITLPFSGIDWVTDMCTERLWTAPPITVPRMAAAKEAENTGFIEHDDGPPSMRSNVLSNASLAVKSWPVPACYLGGSGHAPTAATFRLVSSVESSVQLSSDSHIIAV